MSADQSITITRWKAMDKGPLKGFFEFEKGGFFFADCSYFHSQAGAKWVSLPAKEYTDGEGKKKFYRLCGFRDQARHQAFCNQVLEALDKYLTKPQSTGNRDEDMPF